MAYQETLQLNEKNSVCPDDANYYVAMGAALMSLEYEEISFNDFYKKKMGGNDLYCVINLILYFLSAKDSYLADSFCNNLLKHITPLSNHQNEQIKLELFKSYSNITNLPNDLGNRILAFKKHLT